MTKLNAYFERMMARMDSQLETMKTVDLEDSREKLEAIAEQRDVPKREASMQTIRALVDQCGYRHLA
jgi:hypothetical protein